MNLCALPYGKHIVLSLSVELLVRLTGVAVLVP